jgi:hypothetical protein
MNIEYDNLQPSEEVRHEALVRELGLYIEEAFLCDLERERILKDMPMSD